MRVFQFCRVPLSVGRNLRQVFPAEEVVHDKVVQHDDPRHRPRDIKAASVHRKVIPEVVHGDVELTRQCRGFNGIERGE